MPDQAGKNGEGAGIYQPQEVDVAALFRELQDEVSRLGPRRAGGDGPSAARVNARAMAGRLWRVTADRPPGGRAGVARAVMRPGQLLVREAPRRVADPAFS